MELTISMSGAKITVNPIAVQSITETSSGCVITFDGFGEGEVHVDEGYDEVKKMFNDELNNLYENKTVRMNETGIW